MSITQMARVWNLPRSVSSSQRLVLLALADHAGDSGYCWPSMARIAQKVGIDKRMVMRHIGLLAKAGYITIMHRFRNDGSQTSNAYMLVLPTHAEYDGVVDDTPPSDTEYTPPVYCGTPHEPSSEPPVVNHHSETPALPSSKTQEVAEETGGPKRLDFQECLQAASSVAQDEKNWRQVVEKRHGIKLDSGFARHIDKWLTDGKLRAGVIFREAAEVQATDSLKEKAKALYSRLKEIAEGGR